jgi:hypothetical protein
MHIKKQNLENKYNFKFHSAKKGISNLPQLKKEYPIYQRRAHLSIAANI